MTIEELLWGKIVDYLIANKAIEVSSEFHDRSSLVKEMLENDTTGVVNTVIDYAIESAGSANYRIECSNKNLEELLNEWLSKINIDLLGIVPTGISNLANDYFRELWAGSSFLILRAKEWEDLTVNGNTISVPKALYLANGSSIYVKRPNEKNYVIGTDEYYLDKAQKNNKIPASADEEVIIQKAYARWFDKYPVPYLIRKGVYKNFKAIQILQDKGDEVITKALPYLFLVTMGSEALFNQGVDFKNTDLKEAAEKFREEAKKFKKEKGKIPAMYDTWDKKYSHLIPDFKPILTDDLYRQGYRALLGGLGFVAILQGIGDTRREEVINPKPFISNVNGGVTYFKAAIYDLIQIIVQRNDKKKLWTSSTIKIVSSPLKINIEAILDAIRSGYDRGGLSIQSYVESLGYDYEQEKERRAKELEDGTEDLMYPHLTQNREDVPDRFTPAQPRNDKKEIVEKLNRKKGTPESKNFKAEIEEAEAKYIRIRQIDPDKFDENSFRIIWLSKSGGIKAVIGRLKGEKTTTIQSYLFDKEKWTEDDAKKWVEKHNGSINSSLEFMLANLENDLVKCGNCGYEFDYLSISESGMGWVKCPKCEEAVTQESAKENLEIAPYTMDNYPKYLDKYPKGAIRVWVETFNNVLQKTGDESKAFPIAWNSLKRWLKKHNYSIKKGEVAKKSMEELKQEQFREKQEKLVDKLLKEKENEKD